MRKLGVCLSFVSLAFWSSAAFAQNTNATLRGTVRDATGAVVSGAVVTARNEATGLVRAGTTNSAGIYVFPDLPVGSYELKVQLAGFKESVLRRIQLNVTDVRAVDIQLEVGGATEEVNVEAPAVAVKTTGGDLSGLVSGAEVRELPLNGRNFFQLTQLMPGVSAPDSFNPKDKGLLAGVDLSVSGGSVTSNLWMVDGANNNDVGSNRTVLVYKRRSRG